MSDTRSVKVKGRHVKLVQVVGVRNGGTLTIIKAVFLGVKEEVKAICADVLDKQSILLECDSIPVLLPDRRSWPRVVIRRIPQFDYDVGEVFYPGPLSTIVTGNDNTIAPHAFPVFQTNYGASIPLLKEYAPILWDVATANGYTEEIIGAGLPEGERVYTLNLPKLEVFEQHLLERMPQIYSLALTLVKEDASGFSRAA